MTLLIVNSLDSGNVMMQWRLNFLSGKSRKLGEQFHEKKWGKVESEKWYKYNFTIWKGWHYNSFASSAILTLSSLFAVINRHYKGTNLWVTEICIQATLNLIAFCFKNLQFLQHVWYYSHKEQMDNMEKQINGSQNNL